jgi:hypothetical protein
MEKYPYRQAVGGLMYLATSTRPDVANAVRDVARYLNNPGMEHWVAVKRIFRYLKGTLDLGLTYSPDGQWLHGYADSDWAKCVDTSRSVTGYVFKLAGAAISWRSRLQKTVALSTSEAEYYAMGDAAKDCVFLRQLLEELGLGCAGPTVIFKDNKGCIGMVANPVSLDRSKHIRMRYHYIRELARDKVVSVQKIPRDEQQADMLTKNIGSVRLRVLRSQVMHA